MESIQSLPIEQQQKIKGLGQRIQSQRVSAVLAVRLSSDGKDERLGVVVLKMSKVCVVA